MAFKWPLYAICHQIPRSQARHCACRANGSVMNELDDPVDNGGNFGLQSCHSYMRVFVPMIRASGCPDLTFADAIQVHPCC